MQLARKLVGLAATTLILGTLAGGAVADQIVVTQYGVTIGGWPYMVALSKGYFKEEGADITGILSSNGGGTTIRNILAANVPYGEVGPAIAVQADMEGAHLKIVSDNTTSVADLDWVVKPNSPLLKPTDLKGKKVGYTNPKSVTQGLTAEMVANIGLQPQDVELVKTGGFGEGLAALDLGAIDATEIGEPLLSQNIKKYRILVRGGDVLPALDNTVGVTTEEAAATKGDVIRAIIRARRRGVEFILAHPDDAAPIIAKASNLSEDVVKMALQNILAIKPNGVPYFGNGQIHLQGMQRMMDLQKTIGAMDKAVDIKPYIDTSFLPDDLKAIAN